MDSTALSWSLLLAAAGVAATHTLLGPDHYLPFIMLARARGWSRARTLTITGVCGLGHVLSSILLGGIGVAAGLAIASVELAEGARGSLAAWALVAVGGAYALWGVRHALRRGRGLEPHHHHDHVHIHGHGDRDHQHVRSTGNATTFWALFIVFVLGPCEPLIPLFVVPASRGLWGTAALTAAVFAAVTIACMLVVVAVGREGLERLRLGLLERWTHAAAGSIIAASGLAIVYLGL